MEFYADEHIDEADGFESLKGGRLNPHRGVDINKHPHGTPVPSLTSGVVVDSEYNVGLGWVVQIERTDEPGNPVKFFGYRHLDAAGLAVGTKVEAGDIIGYLGNSGTLSGGSHTCFTAARTRSGVFGDPDSVVDPVPFIKALRNRAAHNSEEDELMSDGNLVFVKYSDAKGHDPYFILYPNGKKRPMSSQEWNARTEFAALNGSPIVIASRPRAQLDKIPNA